MGGNVFAKFARARQTKKEMIGMDATVNTQLFHALRSQNVFDEFMSHLASEFQLCTLFAMLEVLQFQRYCKAYFLANPIAYQTLLPDGETLSLESDRIRLPDALPRSDIVFGDSEGEKEMELDAFFGRTQTKMLRRFEKYIARGSEFEVALDEGTREKYSERMSDENVWFFECEDVKDLYQMMHFADGAIKDMYQLLS